MMMEDTTNQKKSSCLVLIINMKEIQHLGVGTSIVRNTCQRRRSLGGGELATFGGGVKNLRKGDIMEAKITITQLFYGIIKPYI